MNLDYLLDFLGKEDDDDQKSIGQGGDKNTISSKKRKAEETLPNQYEDTNKELRELYLLRKQRREENKEVLAEVTSNISEKVYLNFTTNKVTDEVEKPNANQKPISNNDSPTIWISKLRNYPSDYLTKNMITFEQLISEDLKGNRSKSKSNLQAAFMTTFGFSMDLFEPLLKQGVHFVLADDWKNPSEPRVEKNFMGYPNFTLIRPPKDPTKNFQGTFHAKLYLLKFPHFLRVVISSANSTIDDWNILSNCIWFKDFPKKSANQKLPEVPQNEFDYNKDFSNTLTSFVQAIMPTKDSYTNLLKINIDDYFISDVNIILIPSIPGRHSGSDLEKYGHSKIGAVLRKLQTLRSEQTKSQKNLMTYQTSSLGNIHEAFLKEILSSFIPQEFSLEDLKVGPNQRKLNFGGSQANNTSKIDKASNRVRVIFPTKEYVENCIEGPQSAYCIVLNSKDYVKDTFPKNIFYKFEAPTDYAFHEGIVPHLKVFVVTGENEEINDDTCMYLGSHNFSASAWGRYEKNSSILSIYNTELGILFPPAKGSKEKKVEILNSLSFKFPPERYGQNQVPWTMQFGF